MDNLMVLGRIIGTYDGWDQVGDQIEQFYKFKPIPELVRWLPEGELTFDHVKGIFEVYDDDKVLASVDAVTILMNIPKDY